MNTFSTTALIFSLSLSVFFELSKSECPDNFLFEGFGVYLGSINHFASAPDGTATKVVDKLYSDLKIRHFRTAYESRFSRFPNQYAITTTSRPDKVYNEIHREIGKKSDVSVIVSMFSPPYYMKNHTTEHLLPAYEDSYKHFIRNITSLMKTTFNISVDRVSPVNEPENSLAFWDHTNMEPDQLCPMVKRFNDPLISMCPENSNFSMSESTMSQSNGPGKVSCDEACEILATHAYLPNLVDPNSSNYLKAYYDLNAHERKSLKQIWMTEVSSTYDSDGYEEADMQEAIDLSINIANFLGVTCVQRYYFWFSFTFGGSGESLIWGNEDGTFKFPKKYFAYKHHTLVASSVGRVKISSCQPKDIQGIKCTKFGSTKLVYLNDRNSTASFAWTGPPVCKKRTICCTTSTSDWECIDTNTIPAKSVCSCDIH